MAYKRLRTGVNRMLFPARALSREGVQTLRPRGGPPTVSVVIPALNEARNLEHVFGRLPRGGISEIVLVDGHSVDNTVEVARRLRPDARVVVQNRRGKGNALACGFAAARGDIIVMIDADGSTDPEEIPSFVTALTSGADFAKGSRFLREGGSYDITPMRRIGNRALIVLVNRLFGTDFTDLCYGYNAFWRRCLPLFDLEVGEPNEPAWGDGFEIETLLNLRAACSGAQVTEVPSVEDRRRFGETNLNALRDGLRVLRTIAREYRRATRRSGEVMVSATRTGPSGDAHVPARPRNGRSPWQPL